MRAVTPLGNSPDSMLDVSRLDAGVVTPDSQPVELDALLLATQSCLPGARWRLDCNFACRPTASGTCHVQCRDGRVALQLLLCDYRLADGGRRLDAGLRLKQRSGIRIPLLPIIGETAPDIPRRVRQSGVAVLFKPVDLDRLPRAVEAALQDARKFPEF